MKKSNVMAGLLVGTMLGVMVIGCKNDSPMSFQDDPVTGSVTQFIKLPKTLSLAKIVSDSALITPEKGGKLELKLRTSYVDSVGEIAKLDMKMTLTFPHHCVTDTLMATMSLDDEVLRTTVDLTFGPHGSEFLTPALLDVDIKGMDLSGFSPEDRVYLYYKDNGVWIRMNDKKVTINIEKGELKCKDAELPHFSAYAFGR